MPARTAASSSASCNRAQQGHQAAVAHDHPAGIRPRRGDEAGLLPQLAQRARREVDLSARADIGRVRRAAGEVDPPGGGRVRPHLAEQEGAVPGARHRRREDVEDAPSESPSPSGR